MAGKRMRRILWNFLVYGACAGGTVFASATDVRAQAFDGTWTGTYSCPGAPSGKNPAFTRPTTATVVHNQFRLDDSVENQRQIVQGTVQADGTISALGRGQRTDLRASWMLKFAGKASETDMQLTGSQANRSPCVIELSNTGPATISPQGIENLVSRADQAAHAGADIEQRLEKFGIAKGQENGETANLKARRLVTSALVTKQNAADIGQKIAKLLAKQEEDAAAGRVQDKKARQLVAGELHNFSTAANVAEQQVAEVERQLAGLRTTVELAELRSTQAQDRVETEARDRDANQRVAKLEGLLGEIILPVGENAEDWILRKAAIPIQQQEFCRIIDQFHDNLLEVTKIKNAIRREVLYSDRQKDLNNLLPEGKFENWLVRVEGVTKASDGSAVILLKPPCRVMFGSDPCQDAKIGTTIAPNSRLFGELAKLRTRDFVAISGRFLYKARDTQPDTIPQYIIYEPGQYCLRDADTDSKPVFITEINYLVQLR